jgi:hypothetical protein
MNAPQRFFDPFGLVGEGHDFGYGIGEFHQVELILRTQNRAHKVLRCLALQPFAGQHRLAGVDCQHDRERT